MLEFLLDPNIAFVVLFVAAVADVITTLRALERGGEELNPVIAWMMEHLGGGAWVVAKLAGTIAAGALLMHAELVVTLWLLAALTLYIAWRNHRILR